MELRQRLEAEHQILERIARGASLQETLDALVLLIERQSPDILCSVLLLDSEHGRLRHGAAPSLPPPYVERLNGSLIGPAEGSCGAAAFNAEPVIVEDVLTHPNWTEYRDLASAHSLRACWSTPIFSPGKTVLGTFANYYRVPRLPTAEEREWVEVATHLAAIAITRARTTEALERAEGHARHIARIHAMATSISELFVRPSKPGELFDAACKIAAEKGLARLAWIGEYDEESDVLRITARCGPAADYAKDVTFHLRRPGYERAPATRALAENVPIIANDLANDPDFRWNERTREYGLRSCAIFPMRVEGERPAIFAIYGEREGFFDEEVVGVLGQLTKNIGVAIAVGRVSEERERLIVELNDRVKQMGVVHAVARWLQQSDRPLDESVLSELIETLRPGLRHPALCEVRLRWKDLAAQTPDFRETEWKRIKPIGSEGALELAYRERPPDVEIFPTEEREFLRSLADMFGSHFARVTAESEIREREAQLQLASAATKVGGWTADLAAGRLVWSRQLFALHDLPVGESPKLRDALASFAPEFRLIATAAYDACVRDGTPFDLVVQIITATNRRIWVRALGSAERDSSGKVVRVHCALQDIDERRRLEDQLRQAQKMEAVGRVASGIAHDFNNLLSVILSYSANVVDVLPPGDPVRDDVEQIFVAGKRASELTRQLLTFSRQQPSSPRHLDMARVMAGIDKMLRRVVGEDVTLTVRNSSSTGTVFADRGQVEQVLMNLVVNARDAVGENGKITIEIADTHLDASYAAEHHDVLVGDYVVISVSDNGHGMDAFTRAKVFEPFFTTKEKGKGTGLGLATVYGIVKQSGGHIWLYSEPNVGTTFKIYLPRTSSPPDSEPPSYVPSNRTPMPRARETVLLVEDSEQVRAVSAAILRRAGYTVLEAADGEAAIAAESAHEGKIDLLLTDVVLPRTNGRTLAKKITASRPDVRVLYMSGYGPDAAVEHGMLDPGAAFLAKPITPDALLRKVRDTLTRASAVTGPRHILHVDDDETILILLARMLRRLGYEITGFSDPADAVRAFEENPERYDAVVTDLEMPGLNGFEVIRRVRALRPDVPVVVMSGGFRAEELEAAASLQIHSLIVKANTIDELGRALLAEIAPEKSHSSPT